MNGRMSVGDFSIERIVEAENPLMPATETQGPAAQRCSRRTGPGSSRIRSPGMAGAAGGVPVLPGAHAAPHHPDRHLRRQRQAAAGRPCWHMKTADAYMEALAAAGVSVEDIDFVMCTHMHVDHVGWNTRLTDGRWVPTFPKARYVFARDEYAVLAGRERQGAEPGASSTACCRSSRPGRADMVDSEHGLATRSA